MLPSRPSIVSRLAPTPSGYLHMGNLYNFVLTWLHVRQSAGLLHLRIDDLDQARVRDRYLDDIFYALHWLGLDHDMGPSDVADFKANYSQTLRVDDYLHTAAIMRDRAETFYCQCSRKDLERLSPDRLYQGTCRRLRLPLMPGRTALRLVTDTGPEVQLHENGEVQQAAIHALMPYPVLIKKDGIPSYQVASLTDDHRMGVNLLVRGKDLRNSSYVQAYLGRIAGYDPFVHAVFIHHDLIVGADQLKLSKSQNAPSYDRTQANKAALFTMVAKYMGVERRIASSGELLEAVGDKGL